MDIGDLLYTGCEEEDSGSDGGVRKITDRTSAHLLSNQIHKPELIDQRKQWKSRSTHQLGLQRQPETNDAFSAAPGILLWKTCKQNFLPFTFLMRISIALCQTE